MVAMEEDTQAAKIREQQKKALEAQRAQQQLKTMLRMVLEEDAYERMVNVGLVNKELFTMAAQKIFGIFQRLKRRLTDKEVLMVLKNMRGEEEERKIIFKNK